MTRLPILSVPIDQREAVVRILYAAGFRRPDASGLEDTIISVSGWPPHWPAIYLINGWIKPGGKSLFLLSDYIVVNSPQQMVRYMAKHP